MTTNNVEQKLTRRPKPPPDIKDGLSTGLAHLNLAMTGRPTVGFLPGGYYPMPGKSSSGKTWLALQAMAEACKNPRYDKYQLVNDNPEAGERNLDLAYFFGKKMAARVQPPPGGKHSTTVVDFYNNLKAATSKGPCLYLLDSEDALDPPPPKTGKDGKEKGSYGVEKAKYHSTWLRRARSWLGETGSILIMIKQVRMNMGMDSMFNPETRNGGIAITHYAELELWFGILGKIKKPALGKDRVVGSKLKVTIKKNRQTGRHRTVSFRHYFDTGIDETGSLVDFLVEEGHWEGSDKKVAAPEFEYNGSKEGLIKFVEEGHEKELRMLVAEHWDRIESECRVERKRRYE